MSTVLSKLQHPAVAVNYLALFDKWKYTFVTHFKKFKSFNRDKWVLSRVQGSLKDLGWQTPDDLICFYRIYGKQKVQNNANLFLLNKTNTGLNLLNISSVPPLTMHCFSSLE